MWSLAPRLLRAFDPETAHHLTLKGLQLGLHPRFSQPDAAPAVTLFGKALPNRLGLSAGFDKDAEAVAALAALGFAAVEIGSVTPKPQPGNPKPRVFRLPDDAAVINRYGFNSKGHDTVRRNLDRLDPAQRPPLLGVNLGANKTSENVPADFALGVSRFADLADYLVINVSSPNTPGLRDHQTLDALARILDLALDARARTVATPIMLKIAPDLADEDVSAIVDLALDRGIDGLIATNTTIQRPAGLHGAAQTEAGGLSGAPLFERSTEILSNMREQADDRLVLFGTGGVSSPAQAQEKVRKGADLVQLYTGLIYGGPALVRPLVQAVSKPATTQKVSGLRDAIGRGGIKGLIVDLWGVMHNGKALFPEAVAALAAARADGVKVQFLSNAPRRLWMIHDMLDGMGLDRGLYDGIVSSGEDAWQAMKDRTDPFYAALGPVCYHLGAGEKDHNMREGQDFAFQDDLAGADWILNTGPADSKDLGPWIPLMQRALAEGLPMVCANPDRVVMRGESKELCAGSLAEWYEAQGGSVRWHGKPYASVYSRARRAMGLRRHEVMAIGDSFTTDVAGAEAARIAVLLVNTGIHQSDLDADLMRGIDRLAAEKGVRPTFADDRLRP